MGIHGLSKVIADKAPHAIKEYPISYYAGRKVAIDASMSIYQFLIAVRQNGNVLTNDSGETTSHLLGLFFRTIRMIENGLKPVYVFDGKPPTRKSGELAKRYERRKEAEKSLEAATEKGDIENMDKFNRRMVKVTPMHNEECKKLLTLMGVPHVQAPCEAEAQCAVLARSGKVFACGSEDMDTLTFNAPILLRHLTFSEAKKMPISEINLEKALEGLEMTMEQFIDLCILLGCDYCDSIKGIGPQKAVQLIKEHKSIEKVLENIDRTKFIIPEDWPYKEARELFVNPEVQTDLDQIQIKWTDPDEEGMIQFLCKEKGFNEERVKNGVKKLMAREKKSQSRLDQFFKAAPKRKVDEVPKASEPLKKTKTKSKK